MKRNAFTEVSETQAWCWHAPGEPAGLALTRRALTPPADDEALVANRVVAFNPVDLKLIGRGHPLWRPGQVPGVDGMGVLLAVGANHAHLRPGSRVAYHTDLRRDGSFALHTKVPARALMPVPDSLSDEAAAAFPCPGLTAWQALGKLPRLRGEPILVAGAGGGVGRFAVQLALEQGARVFAAAGVRHHAWLREIGVQAVADYRAGDWPAALREANGGEPFEAAIDLMPEGGAGALSAVLGYYGHLVSVTGRVEQNPMPAFAHCHSLHEIALGAQHVHGSDRQWARLVEAGVSMMRRIADGRLRLPPLVIGAFAELPARLEHFSRGSRGGKYLVRVD